MINNKINDNKNEYKEKKINKVKIKKVQQKSNNNNSNIGINRKNSLEDKFNILITKMEENNNTNSQLTNEIKELAEAIKVSNANNTKLIEQNAKFIQALLDKRSIMMVNKKLVYLSI